MQRKQLTIAAAATTMLGASALATTAFNTPIPQIGLDNNSENNPFVQPQDPALSGGGRDQSQQFGDLLAGTSANDFLQGRLGVDVLLGSDGDDVIVGGTEHFFPINRDRAFGGPGNDAFLWAPGDGSDFFDGGPGVDIVAFGLMGEVVDGHVVFQVSTDQQAGDVYVNPATGLPELDVTNSPGFCEVVDDSTATDAASQLDELGLDHLVRFFIRGAADAFESGANTDDNGLRVTLHLNDVEFLVCTNRDGGQIEVFDLTVSPPKQVRKSILQRTILADVVK